MFIQDRSFAVARFVEKPIAENAFGTAEKRPTSADRWLYLSKVQTLLDTLQAHAPAILGVCQRATQQTQQDGRFTRLDAQVFGTLQSQSVYYALMERVPHAVILSFNGGL